MPSPFASALLPLGMLSGPIQHFQSSFLKLRNSKISAQLADRKGFRGAQLIDVNGTLQQLNSSHLRDRDRKLL